jgi:hypothetical protein
MSTWVIFKLELGISQVTLRSRIGLFVDSNFVFLERLDIILARIVLNRQEIGFGFAI